MQLVAPLLLLVFGLIFVSRSFIVLREYERAVTFWLGKLSDLKQPGLRFVFWPFVSFEKISLRTEVQDVPPQDVITRDNVSVKVNAVVYFRVIDPEKAVMEIEDYKFATSQLAQTTLRSVLGQADLDELLSKREQLNNRLQEIVDTQTDPWGIKVSAVEVKHVDLPQEMQRAMAKQAEAEREKRAKIIHAEGENLAARTLASAAEEVSHRVLVNEGSHLAHRPLSAHELPVQTGMRVMAVRRDRQWITDVDGDLIIVPGDALFLRGSPDGVARLRELAAAEPWTPPQITDDPFVTDLDRAVDVLVEMKNLSEVAVGLAYSALVLGDRGLAAEVRQLEDRLAEVRVRA